MSQSGETEVSQGGEPFTSEQTTMFLELIAATRRYEQAIVHAACKARGIEWNGGLGDYPAEIQAVQRAVQINGCMEIARIAGFSFRGKFTKAEEEGFWCFLSQDIVNPPPYEMVPALMYTESPRLHLLKRE